jgi:ribosomal protein L40E
MNSQHESIRSTLKIIGPIFILAGVLLIVFGIQDVRRSSERQTEQSREFMAGQRDIHDIDHGPPAGFFMIGGGMFAIVIGVGLLGFAFQKALLRYQMHEYAPVVKEAIREVAPGLVGGAAQACPHCQTQNPAAAKFCKQCGSALAQSGCSSCGAANEPEAKFCIGCGKQL